MINVCVCERSKKQLLSGAFSRKISSHCFLFVSIWQMSILDLNLAPWLQHAVGVVASVGRIAVVHLQVVFRRWWAVPVHDTPPTAAGAPVGGPGGWVVRGRRSCCSCGSCRRGGEAVEPGVDAGRAAGICVWDGGADFSGHWIGL